MTDPIVYDCLIIGGGAIGCSIARELSRYKISTILLEKSSDVSQGASKSNSGIIHGGYDEKHGTLKSQVAHLGNQLFSQLDKELNFGFKRIGSLVLAFDNHQRRILDDLLHNGIMNGVEGLKILDSAKVLELEPHCNPNVVAALHCPHTGIASPYEYVIALAENSVMNGATIKLDHEVIDVGLAMNDSISSPVRSANGCHFLVTTNPFGEIFRAKLVINAVNSM